MYKPRFAIGLFLGFFPSLALGQTAGMLSVQGYLKQGDQPVPPTIDIQFRIYDAQSDIPTPANLVDMDGDGTVEDVVGEDTKQVLAVPVSLQGVFSTKFGPVSPKAFNGTSRWLEIRVRPAGGGAFATLSRTEMATAPATAEQVNKPLSGDDVIITDSNGFVGIGTTTPDATLDIRGSNVEQVHIRASPIPNRVMYEGVNSTLGYARIGTFDSQNGGLGFDLVLNETGGNVGIGGVLDPNATLHLVGNATTPFGTVLSIDAHHLTGGKEFWIFATGGPAAGEGPGKLIFKENGQETFMTFDSGTNTVGIGTISPSQKLYVAGNICATGTIGPCSDARFKKHVELVCRALRKVERLRGVTFDWKRDEFRDHQFAEGRQIGLIAQEVQKVVPEVVSKGSDGYLSVDYGRLTPVLIEAMHEQQGQIKSLQEENARLRENSSVVERRLAALEARLAKNAVAKAE